MLYIEKGPCPEEVQQKISQLKAQKEWQDIPGDFSGLSEEERHSYTKLLRKNYFDKLPKQIIRGVLLKEQHYLCAYCMLPITNDGQHMTIEHFFPLSRDKEKAIDYQNFLGTCKGGSDVALEEDEERIICCDARKGDNDQMRIDPRNAEMMEHILYDSDGTIGISESEDQQILQRDLDEILFLNGKLDANRVCIQDTTTELVKKRRDLFRDTENNCLELQEQGMLTLEFLDRKISQCLEVEHREEMVGVKLFVMKFYRNKLISKEKVT